MRRTYSVYFKPKALEDIEEIAAFIEERSGDPFVADIWEASLYEQTAQLKSFPKGHSVYPKSPDYRKLIFGRYHIVFRVDDVALKVVVCRVVSGERLPENIGLIEPDSQV